MPKYRVSLWREDSFSIVVDADNEDEALELGFEEAPSLCAHCSGWGMNGGVGDGEWMMYEDRPDYDEKYSGRSVEPIEEGD